VIQQLRVNVFGRPRPKGSMRIVETDRFGRRLPRARLIHDNSEKTSQWARNVAGAALAAVVLAGRDQFPWRGHPLSVALTFRFDRPQTHFGKRGLLPSAPEHHAVKPDVDKLARAALDALTGIVYDDDARIVELHASKAYCAAAEVPGAFIDLRVLGAQQLALEVAS